jgi:cytochrome c oxidase cbb3-type subunit 3
VTRKRDELLDHEADGIREFDNDLPRWWLYGFYFTIVFAAVYLVNYHVLAEPFLGEKTVVAEYDAEVRAANALRPAPPAQPPGAAGAAVATVVALTDADSLAKGKTLFESPTNPCMACHRPDLGGLVGPNLTDEHWLHGCSPAGVVQSIKVGFPTKGMLPYGGGPALTDEQVLQLASYILSKRGSNPPGAKAKDLERDQECE